MDRLLIMMYEDNIDEIKIEKDFLINDRLPFLVINKGFIFLKDNYAIGTIKVLETISFFTNKDEDFPIELNKIKDAMSGDIVVVKLGNKPSVEYIVKRALEQIIVDYKLTRKGYKLDNPKYRQFKINVDIPDIVVDGNVISLDVVAINGKRIDAKFNKIIGHINDPDIEIDKIVATFDWPTGFSDLISKELEDINKEFQQEVQSRKDFTNLYTFTIDGKDAKDLDDAISIDKYDDIYEVGIHIADVSYYVREGSEIDKEAYVRGNSAYLANKVIPMLPHKLSNDLCSLNMGSKKLAVSLIIRLNDKGEVINSYLYKSVIESKERLNYEDVNNFFKGQKNYNNNFLEDKLLDLLKLSKIINSKRKKEGKLEFKSSEIYFKTDDKGIPYEVNKRESDLAEDLIESLMVLANEEVAKIMIKYKVPSVYRVHEAPEINKLEDAVKIIKTLGIHVKNNKINNPFQLQSVLNKVRNTNIEYIVNSFLLRSMQKAKYSDIVDIHFGLGLKTYSHFTAPIRRYSDLTVHRMLDYFIFNNEKRKDYYFPRMEGIAKHVSEQERKAIEMEREVTDLKSCQYMLDKIDDRFEGKIVQMMRSGMFIELTNGIEGFVRLKTFDSFYHFDEENLLYINHFGQTYRLGQTVSVKLIEVNMMERQIDFKVIEKKKGRRKRWR